MCSWSLQKRGETDKLFPIVAIYCAFHKALVAKSECILLLTLQTIKMTSILEYEMHSRVSIPFFEMTQIILKKFGAHMYIYIYESSHQIPNLLQICHKKPNI